MITCIYIYTYIYLCNTIMHYSTDTYNISIYMPYVFEYVMNAMVLTTTRALFPLHTPSPSIFLHITFASHWIHHITSLRKLHFTSNFLYANPISLRRRIVSLSKFSYCCYYWLRYNPDNTKDLGATNRPAVKI